MTATSPHPAMLSTRLEDILVAEFRAYGELVACSRQERAFLTQADVTPLTTLLEQKERIVDELNQLERRRQVTLREWAGNPAQPLTLADLLPLLDPDLAERVSRLREGILVMVERERELARGNRLLASAALERTEAMRTFLVNLSAPLEGYRPPGAPTSASLAASLTAERWA